MKKLSCHEMVRRLEGEGLKFCQLQLVSEGDYAADDSDWNYKDIPHLHHVHDLAEAYPALIGGDVICSINMQSILGVWFPIALTNYEFQKHHQIYYTTLFFFVLVIETITEEIATLRTRVTTTYNIGGPKWLFFMMPILKALIRKNYHVLMSTDIPMRVRRGELRKMGYSFAKNSDTYKFDETLDISGTNTLLPAGASRRIVFDYEKELGAASDVVVGDRGLTGVRLVREGNDVLVFPRTCPHEGASLDGVDCKSGAIKCVWHGRRFKPIVKFTWGEEKAFQESGYRGQIAGKSIIMEYVGDLGVSRPTNAA